MSTSSAGPVLEDSLPTRKSLLDRLKTWPEKPDDDSWQEFFNIYWQLIYSEAKRAGLSEDDAQEVVQRTVIAVAKSLPDFKYEPERIGQCEPGSGGSRSSFKTWLRLIVRRRICDVLRTTITDHKRSVPLAPDSARPNDSEFSAGSATSDLDAKWDHEYEQALVSAALLRVKKRTKAAHIQAYTYHVLEDHSAQDTCSHLGLSRARLYVITHRVGREMKKELAQLREKLI